VVYKPKKHDPSFHQSIIHQELTSLFSLFFALPAVIVLQRKKVLSAVA